MTSGDEKERPADPAPLFRALREAQAHAKSGRLHLLADGELRQLRFLAGRIADASSDVSGERLGDVLVRHGLLSQGDLDRAVGVVLRERKRLGPVLAEMGLLDDARIREGIGWHVREVVLAALGGPSLTVAFEELPETLVEADFECPLSAAQLILDAVRAVDLVHVRRAIAGNDDRVVTLCADEPGRALKVTLTPADGFVLSRVDGTQGAADLARVIPLPAEEFERSLFGLFATGLVHFVEKAPVAPRPRPAPEPEPSSSPIAETAPLPPAGSPAPMIVAPAAAAAPKSPDELRRRIVEAHRGLDRTHYEVLGLGQDATAAEVRAAYARLMRTFHPDAVRAPELADVEEKRQAVCLRAGEAYEVLKDEQMRAAYDNNLKLWRRKVPAPPLPPAGEPEPGPRVDPPAPDSAREAATTPAPPVGEPVRTAAPASPAPTPAGPGATPAGASAGAPPRAEPPTAEACDPVVETMASAQCLIDDGQFWDAIRQLEPLLPRLTGPARARARMLLAQAYARNPRWRRRAEEALRLAIEDSPGDVEPRLLLASLYLDLHLPARAATLYRAVLEMDPRNRAAREALSDPEPVAVGQRTPARRPAGVFDRLLRRP